MTLLKPGQPAPLFHLIDQRSHLVDLGQALEKGAVLLLFYRRDFEPKTASTLRQWKHWLEANNGDEAKSLQLIAISSDEWERHHQFANQLALPFAVLYDHLGKVSKRYGCQVLPVIWSREASVLIENRAIAKRALDSAEATQSQNIASSQKTVEAVVIQSFSGLLSPENIQEIALS